jgi:hypothetical protein
VTENFFAIADSSAWIDSFCFNYPIVMLETDNPDIERPDIRLHSMKTDGSTDCNERIIPTLPDRYPSVVAGADRWN